MTAFTKCVFCFYNDTVSLLPHSSNWLHSSPSFCSSFWDIVPLSLPFPFCFHCRTPGLKGCFVCITPASSCSLGSNYWKAKLIKILHSCQNSQALLTVCPRLHCSFIGYYLRTCAYTNGVNCAQVLKQHGTHLLCSSLLEPWRAAHLIFETLSRLPLLKSPCLVQKAILMVLASEETPSEQTFPWHLSRRPDLLFYSWAIPSSGHTWHQRTVYFLFTASQRPPNITISGLGMAPKSSHNPPHSWDNVRKFSGGTCGSLQDRAWGWSVLSNSMESWLTPPVCRWIKIKIGIQRPV